MGRKKLGNDGKENVGIQRKYINMAKELGFNDVNDMVIFLVDKKDKRSDQAAPAKENQA